MPTLAVTVHVRDPETGRSVVLNHGTEVSGRLLTLISNPDVWKDPEEAARAQSAFNDSTQDDSDADVAVEPPRAGKGSSREAWSVFAAERGVQVDDEDARDDIIAALVDAGVIEG